MDRKLSISRAWDETRNILARDGKLFATVAAALLVLPGIVRDLATPPAEPGQLPPPGAWMLVWVVAVLIALVGQLALTRLALTERTTVGEAIGHSARRMPVYLAGQLIWVIPFVVAFSLLMPLMRPPQPSGAAALVFLLCFVLFVFVSVRMILAAPVSVQEPVGPVAMLRRSWNMTAGKWWRLFGFLLLFLIGAAIVVLSTIAVFGLLARMVFGDIQSFSLGALLVSLAAQVVTAGVYVVLMPMLARLYVQASGAAGEASVPSSGT